MITRQNAPSVENGAAMDVLVAVEMWHRERWQPTNAEPFVFPRQVVVGQIDLFVNHLDTDAWTGRLTGRLQTLYR